MTNKELVEHRLPNAVKEMYVTRLLWQHDKKKFKSFRGNCEYGGKKDPCYKHKDLSKEKWCEPCLRNQPLWEEWHRSYVIARTALIRVIKMGKQLSGN